MFILSRFLKVVCECGESRTVFGDSKQSVECKKCHAVLVQPRGGRAKINCRIVEVLS
ncbi:30S ribosomal protein S27e [Candidatus Micrarchaeota archaeon]|nr:30S ribosomal protein S27e [Candidatus Micrarchaeota archaeon]